MTLASHSLLLSIIDYSVSSSPHDDDGDIMTMITQMVETKLTLIPIILFHDSTKRY